MELISDSFELRYISKDKSANGETDFKGETSTLTTEQRVDFLNAYAERMSRQYDDYSLDKPIVSLEEAKERLLGIKPQPSPKKRKRILLDEWKWVGYRKKKAEPLSRIIANRIELPKQTWRCMLELELREFLIGQAEEFSFGETAVFGWEKGGTLYYITNLEWRGLIEQ